MKLLRAGRSNLWGIFALMAVLLGETQSAIPPEALMKVPSGSQYVFPADSPYVLRPPLAPADAQPAIQSAIDAAAGVRGADGAVIFLQPGNYLLKKPVVIHGNGVSLVGLRDWDQSEGWGSYPTLTYGDDFADPDFANRATIQEMNGGGAIDALQFPAVVRINGAPDYSRSSRYGGLRGVKIQYTGTGAAGDGSIATGLALHRVSYAVVQDISVTGSGQLGPYNGIHIGTSFRFFGRNFTILNVRGEFGLRCGDWAPLTGAAKYHGVTITSSGTTANLVEFRSEGELIGAKLSGGRVGVKLQGSSPNDGKRAANCTLRGLLVENSAQQGITIGSFHGVGLTDIVIRNSNAEGLRVLDTFYGGLQITNLTVENAGLSAVRVERGMNIGLTNATLVDSGRLKGNAASTDQPAAGIYIDRAVTSFNVVGTRIGASTPKGFEDFGIYWAPTGPGTPWHEPTVLASNITFLPNVAHDAHTNTRPAPLPTLSIRNPGGYDALVNAGFFRPMAGDSWNILPSNCDFADPTLKYARGFNWYDLDQIRGKQWIDLTKTAVVDSEGTLNSGAFTELLEEVTQAFGPEGAVLYLPAGAFSHAANAVTFTPRTYRFAPDTPGLVIDKPGIQLLGDGAEITRLAAPGSASIQTAPPLAPAIAFEAGSAGSGLFGLAVMHDRSAAVPVRLAIPYPRKRDTYSTGDEVPEGFFGVPFSYAPSVVVKNTADIRIGGVHSNHGMGGGFAVIDTSNSELYQTNTRAHVNNGNPEANPAGYLVSGPTPGKTFNLRLSLTFAGGLDNIFLPTATFGRGTSATTLTNRLYRWNDVDNFLSYDQLPKFDSLRIQGDVRRVHVNSATYIHGRNGLMITSLPSAAGPLVPHDIDLFRFATDHINGIGINVQNVVNADFLSCWTNAHYMICLVGPEAAGDIRFTNLTFRGTRLEGLSVRGGNTVSLVNCQAGRNIHINDAYPAEDRPLAGIFIGDNASPHPDDRTSVIGGSSGWLFYRLNSSHAPPTQNDNRQDWGIVLGSSFDPGRFRLVGVDLYGNGGPAANHPSPTDPPSQSGFHRGLGVQTSGQDAVWKTDGPNWP